MENIKQFSDEILQLGEPIIDNRLEIFENQICFILPDDYKYILKKYNGLSVLGTEVLGLDKKFMGNSMDSVYNFEHNEVFNKMPIEFMPFSPDGRGNFYCLNLSKLENGVCPIIFWQHDFEYKSKEDVETCNINFMEWVKEVLIDWTLEEYNYDGSEI